MAESGVAPIESLSVESTAVTEENLGVDSEFESEPGDPSSATSSTSTNASTSTSSEASEREEVSTQTYIDETYSIHIEAPADALPSDAQVHVQDLSSSEQLLEKLQAYESDLKANDLRAFEIHFETGAGERCQPVLPVQVVIGNISSDPILLGPVYHLDTLESGVEEIVDAYYDSELQQLSFTTASFSIFAFRNARQYAGELYLDGKNGDDAADGLTPETAVKTFEKAKELATTHQTIKKIWICGTVPVNGELSLAGTNAALYRYEKFKDYLLLVYYTEATFSDITIDGNHDLVQADKSAIRVVHGTVNIHDGTTIQNNHVVPLDTGEFSHAQGGGIYALSSTINMSGGAILKNLARRGGGIFLSSRSTMNMSAGVIEGNEARSVWMLVVIPGALVVVF
ncbi:MAG: hypothetical protein Q4P72_02395 [Eubacteriales bacterium]|nr:hypothetical protein [Eubacteriales bacterium]